MNIQDDNSYKALLADYVTPVEDDGFSASILKKLQVEKQGSIINWRKTIISLAAFIGGMIAAKQLPALSNLSHKALALKPDISLSPPYLIDPSIYTWLGLSIVASFALWSLLEMLIDI